MTKFELSQISGVVVALFAASIAAGVLTAKLVHHPAPLVAGVLAGVYLLFAIRVVKPGGQTRWSNQVVKQWEKVAALQLGRYIVLRGPGVFHMIPVIQTLSAFVDRRVRVANLNPESTLHPGYGSGSTWTPLCSG